MAYLQQEKNYAWIAQLIQAGNTHSFYTSPQWERVRVQALELDRYECQRCKARGRYRKAVVVHHVKHLKDRPDLGISIWQDEEGRGKCRQLVSLCRECHEAEHPERFRRKWKPPLTPERW